MLRLGTLLSVLLALQACRNGERPLATTEAAPAGRPWIPARTAEIYFSTEVSGYVEPCGCTSKPLGGLQRLASVMRRGGSDRALVDAGNLLLPASGLTEVTREQHLLKARIIARAYRQLGAVALNVAEADLAGGLELLRDLQREGAVPLVSANVRPFAEGGPDVARSFTRKIGGIKVGFTGAATPERVAGTPGVTVLEYAPAVAAEVAALRKAGAEVVVVLAHVGEAGARELARAVEDIDVILRAPGTPIERPPGAPVRVGGVVIAEAGSQGQHLGRLTLRLGPGAPERPLALEDGQEEERRRARIQRKLEAYRVELATWSAQAAHVEAVRAREAQIAGLEAELEAPAAETSALAAPHLAFDLVPLAEDVPADETMTKLLAAYYRGLEGMNAEKGDLTLCAPGKDQPTYVGTAKCAECHEEAFAFWQKTKHAAAWATLETRGKHFDLTCVGCHVVGWEKPGGFCRIKDAGALKDVGCEMCHGAGSRHAVDQDADSIALKVTEATCAGACHVPEHSDGFDFQKYLRQITGPGHELSGG